MQSPAQVRPGFLFAAVRRRAWLIVLSALLGATVGLLLAARQSPEYESSATIFLEPLEGNPFAPDTPGSRSEQLAALETEAALFGTETVAELAGQSENVDLEDNAQARVRASIPSNSQVLVVSYRSDSPVGARRGVEAFTEAYLAYRAENASAAFESRTEALDRQIEQTTEQLAPLRESLASVEPGSPSATVLEEQAQVLASQIAGLQFELTELRSKPTDPGTVISAATLPQSPTGLPGAALVTGSVVVALGAGVVLALLLEYRDPRIRDDHDLLALGLGRPLANIDLRANAEDRSEAFSKLSGAVLARDSNGPRACVVAAPSTNVRVGPLTAGLAQAAERSGVDVIVVFAGNDDITEMPPFPSVPGLTDLVPEGFPSTLSTPPLGSKVSDRIVAIGVGSQAARAQDLFQHSQFKGVLQRLATDADLVVVDGPALCVAAGQALARAGDEVLLAVQYDHTTFEEILAATEILNRDQVDLVGVVAFRAGRSSGGRGRKARSRPRPQPSTTGTPPRHRARPLGPAGRNPNGTTTALAKPEAM